MVYPVNSALPTQTLRSDSLCQPHIPVLGPTLIQMFGDSRDNLYRTKKTSRHVHCARTRKQALLGSQLSIFL